LARQDPKNAQIRNDLAVSYDILGNTCIQEGDLKAAREFYKKSQSLFEQLSQQNPESAQTALELGVSFYKLGQVYRAAKQYPEAESMFRKAQDQLGRLKTQGKMPPAMEQVLATTKKELNALPH